MFPSALVSQLHRGIVDFLASSFWVTDERFAPLLPNLAQTPGGLFQGPWLSLRLPFVPGSGREGYFAAKLPFVPHQHQERAFLRLQQGRSTLIATGTGSGKTESFLFPILDHCARERAHGNTGIKALLVYPMNALASDQALRLARLIHQTPEFKGITAGMYVGQESKHTAQHVMGPEHIITDHQKLCLDPPDILLTNYKMLDYLLVRARDQELWRNNAPHTLRFVVVDELHTFDGAQGADLACLLRRVKGRLGTPPGHLCCIGTSATLGGDGEGSALRTYAANLFGESFDAEAVITEQRLSTEQFFAQSEVRYQQTPSAGDRARLDATYQNDVDAYLQEQHQLWFGQELTREPGWRVALGERLRQHSVLPLLLRALQGKPARLDELVKELSRVWPELERDAEFGRAALLSLVSLVSAARVWRDAPGGAEGPFLQVQVQLWLREMRRLVAEVSAAPVLRFHADLTHEQTRQHLPLLHCDGCGFMAWVTLIPRDRADLLRVDWSSFYRAFFAKEPDANIAMVVPVPASVVSPEIQPVLEWASQEFSARRSKVKCEPVRVTPDLTAQPWASTSPNSLPAVLIRKNVEVVDGREQFCTNCPRCDARNSLRLVGYQAATLTSVYVNQLFASPFNDDKKLLAFSDSVQDAAHRAGFMGTRTWRFSLRIAMQRAAQKFDGCPMPALAGHLWEMLCAERSSTEAAVATLIAPDMEWLSEYEEMCQTGRASVGLVERVKKRLSWEVFYEYCFQARIGRTLSRNGVSVVAPDAERLARASEVFLPQAREKIGGMQALSARVAWVFLAGLLRRLQERGGVLHEELRRDYLETGGEVFLLNRREYMPRLNPKGRLPAFVTDRAGGGRFDLLRGPGASSWYDRWFRRCLQVHQDKDKFSLVGVESSDVYELALAALCQAEVLERLEIKQGRVWGIRPESLRVHCAVSVMRCHRCLHTLSVPSADAARWEGAPCQNAPCDGEYRHSTQEPPSYFGGLYRRGDSQRLFVEEHTGLLTRERREEVEGEFKSSQPQPWWPNVLSCTPTLEMGIDIGDLSSVILCSVPRSQASYLQRVGRAGRRDGNSLLLTIARGYAHDLYFFAAPEEMLVGEVAPPGVFLNASAVLERQLVAYSFDRWVSARPSKQEMPNKLSDVLRHLDAEKYPNQFPHNWMRFVSEHQDELLRDFFGLFGEVLQPETRDQLSAFLRGGESHAEGSMLRRVLQELYDQKKSREDLQRNVERLKKALKRLQENPAQDQATLDERKQVETERNSMLAIIEAFDARRLLEFLTDMGFLPNYAFPEAAVRLQSLIHKPPTQGPARKRRESKTYEYGRAASSAITELAPENTFYASGHKVTIERVDMSLSTIAAWRFCDRCHYAAPVAGEESPGECPACHSPSWADAGQQRELLLLRQVFASASDRDSRISDDAERRQETQYDKQILVHFRKEEQRRAWLFGDGSFPFAFEYVPRATFRECNFGPRGEQGARVTIAGRESIRRGFTLCRACGRVQPEHNPRGPLHTFSCPSRDKGASALTECAYLFREFSSEAVSLLLPMTEESSELQRDSFMAALRLGLQLHFQGTIEHLDTTDYSEPDSESGARKQFLVLYDKVPGGTGYLKELTREPQTLFRVLSLSLAHLESCACADDEARDGCYRCLLAHRGRAVVSRHEAVLLLRRLMKQRDEVHEKKSLREISIGGVLDSELEERFLRALREASSSGPPTKLVSSIEKGKPAYRLTVGDSSWVVTPQVLLTEKDGLSVPVSIDFVFSPTRGEGRSIAVFTDGFQFHHPRVSLDWHQRMALLASGKYDVWSFSWQDVDHRLRATGRHTRHFFPVEKHTRSFAQRYGVTDLLPWLGMESFDLFLLLLANPSLRERWEKLALSSLLGSFLSASPAEREKQQFLSSLGALLPDSLRGALPDEKKIHLSRVLLPSPESPWVSIGLVGEAEIQQEGARALHAFFVLDDPPEHVSAPGFREAWNGLLRALNLYQVLPHLWFWGTRPSREDYRALVAQRAGTPRAATGPWQEEVLEMLSSPAFVPLVEALRAAGAPMPEVGFDLVDDRDITIGVQAELCWDDLSLAVVEAGAWQAKSKKHEPAARWKIFDLHEMLLDAGPLLAALQAARGEN